MDVWMDIWVVGDGVKNSGFFCFEKAQINLILRWREGEKGNISLVEFLIEFLGYFPNQT